MKRKFLVCFSYYNSYGQTNIDSYGIEISGPINQDIAADVISKSLDSSKNLIMVLGWSLIEE